jgi:hypothetical protein
MSHDNSGPPDRSPERTAGDNTVDIADEETKLVVEFAVPAVDFLLAETLEGLSSPVLEFEQLVPSGEPLLPYLWLDGDATAFEEAAVNDPTVASIRRVAAFDAGSLYRVEWADAVDGLVSWLRRADAVVLGAETADGRWQVKLRVDSRSSLGDLQAYCRDRDVAIEVRRLYELTEPKLGQFDVSEKQREILVLALRMGYFDIPRGATLEEVASRLDISSKAASERLRRGQSSLVGNTLTVGRPPGVGLDADGQS